MIKKAYDTKSSVDIFKKILEQRDQVLGTTRPPELQTMLERLSGEELSVNIKDGISSEGLILTTTFEDPKGYCRGNRAIYTTQLVVGEDGNVTVWKYANEKMDSRGGVCN